MTIQTPSCTVPSANLGPVDAVISRVEGERCTFLLTLETAASTFRFTAHLDRDGMLALRGLIDEALATAEDEEAKPLDPLTSPGWYELDDRGYQEFKLVKGRLVGGRVAESWDDVLELRADDAMDQLQEYAGGVGGDLEPVGDVAPGDTGAIACVRSKGFRCEVRSIYNASGPRYEIGYVHTTGQYRCVTGSWTLRREAAIARMRKFIADGEVAVRT